MNEHTEPGPCPDWSELARFCWGEGSDTMRADIVCHLACCLACRRRATILAGDSGSDEGALDPDSAQ